MRGCVQCPKRPAFTPTKSRRENKMQSRPLARSMSLTRSSALSRSEGDPSKGGRARLVAISRFHLNRFVASPAKVKNQNPRIRNAPPESVSSWSHGSSLNASKRTQRIEESRTSPVLASGHREHAQICVEDILGATEARQICLQSVPDCQRCDHDE